MIWKDYTGDTATDTPITAKNMIDYIYPIGCIYLSVNATNPGTYLGGTWQEIAKGRTLVGVDNSQTEFNEVKKTGGAKTHKLTIAELPSHNHGILGQHPFTAGSLQWALQATNTSTPNNVITSPEVMGSTGGGTAHNNLQPYFTCYMWERIS